MMYIDLMACILWRCMIYIRCDCWEILYMHVDVICWRRNVYFLIYALFACFIALIEIRRYNPHHSRFRSPRHSMSIRSPSYTRRSARRRSPRRSPPRRSPPRQSPPRRFPPRRFPPRRIRRSWSSSSSKDTHDAQNDLNAYSPLTQRVREAPIPRGLEKPPQMDSYDGTTDPDEHIKNIEAVLTYRSCKAP